jgi:hypothetical protein
MSVPVPKPVNGIYSFFIRGTGIRVHENEVRELKNYAVKTIESENSILYIGRYWIAVVDKLYGDVGETMMVRCFKDICEPHEEIELRELYDEYQLIIDVNVECEEWKKIDNDVVDYECIIKYKYIRYNGIIGITIDPLDILQIARDDELKLLVKLMSRGALLVRPM